MLVMNLNIKFIGSTLTEVFSKIGENALANMHLNIKQYMDYLVFKNKPSKIYRILRQ